ncbi:tail tubular protein A' [Pasteurella phage PHB01]|uniref:Tail tubular protein A n=1 Tax=Pasteurella phage PHB01 TaxID=2006930 RepID=A0A218M4G9_9CAUD|nr:tail protein [Pasteurella phage PHB01]ASD51045.1 tail tubular protein A' [Pasteurella phage PHB01]
MQQDLSITTSVDLEAVNQMLSAIGESAVSTLDGEANADVANAKRLLNEANREIQSKGWTFNTYEQETLLPDVFSGLIPYSSDYLLLMTSGTRTPYVNRGGYVYDSVSKTDVFPSGIVVDIIKLQPLDEMPEPFRRLIVKTASRRLNQRFFGAPEVDAALQEEIAKATIDCNIYEVDYGSYNGIQGDNFINGLLAR